MARTPKVVTALSAVTSTVTSNPIDVANAVGVTLAFSSSSTLTNRTGTLYVTGSVDGTSYVYLNTLIDNAAAAGNTNTTIASKALTAASTTYLLSLYNAMPLMFIKVVLVGVDAGSPAGTFTVKVLVQDQS